MIQYLFINVELADCFFFGGGGEWVNFCISIFLWPFCFWWGCRFLRVFLFVSVLVGEGRSIEVGN